MDAERKRKHICTAQHWERERVKGTNAKNEIKIHTDWEWETTISIAAVAQNLFEETQKEIEWRNETYCIYRYFI